MQRFAKRTIAVIALAAMPMAARAQSPRASGEVVVPEGTRIPLELESVINSRTAYVGQSVYCRTIFPIVVNNRIVIPVGSYVRGSITEVKRPGRIRGKAQLGLRFEWLTLPSGITRRLRATLSGFSGTGKEGFSPQESKIKGASSKGKDAGRVARTTVTGAEIGTLAGIGARHALEGLGIGSLAGAGAGAIWVMATRGREIVLPRGTNLELRLNAPLDLNQADLNR